MDIIAVQKNLIASPQKLREVTQLITKLTPQDAVERLPFVGRRAADPLRKVIVTAIANAKQKGLDVESLTFKEIQINEGPRLKRFHAGSRGRAKPYKKRMSHIRVVLTSKEKVGAQETKTEGKDMEKAQETNLVNTKETKTSIKDKVIARIRKEKTV